MTQAVINTVTKPDTEARIGQDDVALLKCILTQFMARAGIPKVATTLDKWCRGNQERLKAGAFHQHMLNFPESFEIQQGAQKPPLDVGRLLLVASGVDPTADADVENKLMRAVAWHLRIFAEQFQAQPAASS